MIPSKLSLGQLDGGSSICARLLQIPVVFLFLIAIVAQATVQFRSTNQLTQHQIPEIPAIPTKSSVGNSSTDIELDIILSLDPNESGKISIEGNAAVDYGDSFTGETTEELDNVMTDDEKNFTRQKIINELTTIRNKKKRGNKKKKRKTRLIYGIMTYDSKPEQKRRGLIRRTFLNYFENSQKLMNVSEEEYIEKKHWICSLNDLDYGRLEHPEKCRMAYAFVQGANPNGTSMLLTVNETYPLSLPQPNATTEKEEKDFSDMIFLNIKENGKFGKTPTWFRYAIDVLERHGWMNDWDYIFKSDTDNLLYTPNFFRYVDKKLPRRKDQLVYGGLPLDYKKCGGDKHDHCKDMVGPYFMQGGCYFLSIELARFITDETAFDHEAVKLPHEDMTTGNFVYSHPGTIKVIRIKNTGETFRKHPVKEERKFKFRWEKMLREERARRSNDTVL
mmetsp:Transcript_16501/g.41405  ORF Transcript_16501/g.41405 Transcript_16501/m.41405 type:complete len:447 (+) Transcript_16501:133-1473(+)